MTFKLAVYDEATGTSYEEATNIETKIKIGSDRNSPLYKFSAKYWAMRMVYGAKSAFFPAMRTPKQD